MINLIYKGHVLYELVNTIHSNDFQRYSKKQCGNYIMKTISDNDRRNFANISMWPFRVMWDLTDKCNLYCPYCINSSSPNINEKISTEDALKIVRILSDGGVSKIALLGGEPLCHPGFVEIISAIAANKTYIELVTNGLLIKGKYLDAILENKNHFYSIQLSLHCHDKIDKYTKLIKFMMDQGISIFTIIVVTYDNLESIPYIYEKVADTGLLTFHIAVIGEFGRAKNGVFKNQVLSTLDLLKLMLKLETVKSTNNYVTTPTFKHRGKLAIYVKERLGINVTSNICQAGIQEFHILSDGKCRPCSFIDQADYFKYTTEPIQNMVSLSEIWQGKEFKSFRQDKIWSDKSPILQSCYICKNRINGMCRPCIINRSACNDVMKNVTNNLEELYNYKKIGIGTD